MPITKNGHIIFGDFRREVNSRILFMSNIQNACLDMY